MADSPKHSLEVVEVPLSALHPFEGNARRGDVSAIARSLHVNGQFKPIVVNRGTLTGRPDEVLAGNHTLAAAGTLGWRTLQAVYVDVDQDRAVKIVLADNRTNDVAGYDTEALIDLLSASPDFDGTGFTRDDLDDLIASLEEGAPGSADLIQPGEDEYAQQYGVIVVVGSEHEQATAYDRLTGMGFKCKVVTV